MALVTATLTASLLSALRNPARRTIVAARRLADGYADYALSAHAGLGLPVFTGLEGEAMAQVFYPVFSRPRTGSAYTFAQVWVEALLRFWTLPPVVFTAGLDIGVPAPIPGADATLTAALVSLAAMPNPAEVAAVKLSSAIDLYTRSFLVTYAPSATVFPIL